VLYWHYRWEQSKILPPITVSKVWLFCQNYLYAILKEKMGKKVNFAFISLLTVAFALPTQAFADCKAEPTSIFKVGKIYASADMTRLTDENCTGVVYRPDLTKAMTYKGTTYVMKVEKVDDNTGPIAYYKVVSVQKQ
jgi:hypothetical protein